MVLALALVFSVSVVTSDPQIIRIPAKFHVYEVGERRSIHTGHLFTPLVEIAADGKENMLKGFTHPCEGQLPLSRQAISVYGDWLSKEERYSKIWIDWNGDGESQTHEVARYVGKRGRDPIDTYAFEYKPTFEKDRRYLDLVSIGGMVGFRTNAFFGGECQIQGLKTIVQISDSNLDGIYGNGEGVFGDDWAVAQESERRRVLEELQRSGKLLRLTGNTYYSASLSKDHKTIILRKQRPKLGQIRLADGEILALSVSGKVGWFSLGEGLGDFSLPEGHYKVDLVKARFRRKNKSSIECMYDLGRNHMIDIRQHRTTVMTLGKPSRLILKHSQEGKDINFVLSCYSKQGYRFQNIVNRLPNGEYKHDPSPLLTVLNASGKQVYQDAMVFGWGMDATASWTPDPSLPKGNYTVKVNWSTKAFGMMSCQTKYALK